MNIKAKKILQKTDVDKLPSLPHVLLQLLNICHHESVSFNNLAATLRQDPALYTRVYSACHSNQCLKNSNKNHPQAANERYTEQSVEPILQQLGINTINSIAVTATVQQFFSPTSVERTEFLKQHWQHSLHCANVARSIAQHCNYYSPDEAYTTGLIHDIGQLVLETTYPDKYTASFVQLTEDDYLHTLEQDEFGVTHQQVGAELLKKHGASSFIYDAVLYHHELTEHILDAHPLVKIINLANMLTSSHFKKEDQKVFDSAEQLLALNKPLLLEILEKSQEQVKAATSSLGMMLTVDGMDGETASQQTASDEYKQVQLAEQVRNIALLDSIHQHLARSGVQNQDMKTLLPIVFQHIGILFGVNQCILFLYDAADNRVKAVICGTQPAQLADLSIPLTAGRSLVTEALLNRQAMHSFNEAQLDSNTNKLAIIDRQLIGLTEQDGMICLPMMINNTAIGTLILGVDKKQYQALWNQMPLLKRFVNEVTHSISISNPDMSPAKHYDNSSQLENKIREVLHEVRNPLSIMNNYLGILSYKLENDKPAQEDVQTIKSEIVRISQILDGLTETEVATSETSPVDINAVITDLSNVFQTSLFADKHIQVSLDLDERIQTLQSNTNAIKQIYTNLVKNAVEALPANGQLMVYTQDNVNVDGKEHIELSVADDGPGMDTETLSQLFSPMVSTKGGDHAGLGLTIVKNLVNELHGSISCRSSDKGTGFYILFPK
jgi:signal transduction histidine kinase/HD-like signal output (HDOD) protein